MSPFLYVNNFITDDTADLLIKIKMLWSYMLFIIWLHKENAFWCTDPSSNKSDSLLIHSIFWSLLGNEVFIFMCKKVSCIIQTTLYLKLWYIIIHAKPKPWVRQPGKLDEPLQFSINQIIVYCSAELPQATQI